QSRTLQNRYARQGQRKGNAQQPYPRRRDPNRGKAVPGLEPNAQRRTDSHCPVVRDSCPRNHLCGIFRTDTSQTPCDCAGCYAAFSAPKHPSTYQKNHETGQGSSLERRGGNEAKSTQQTRQLTNQDGSFRTQDIGHASSGWARDESRYILRTDCNTSPQC